MRCVTVAMFIAALAVAGCGKSSGSLSGNVSYQGKPVTGGVMLLVDAKGRNFPASLNADGTYKCPEIPPGDYTVTINTSALKGTDNQEGTAKMLEKQGLGNDAGSKQPKDLAKVKEMSTGAGKLVSIPPKYASTTTSTLTVKVEGGKQIQDFTLTD
ncbi:MAG: carboxypeptidase regulatory-like domain-containing protein [Planctomycetes bacterium]|nr:carboxypeptidase regulatory-like domain-containing protein [Planctomycetota bacterium]